MTKVKQYYIQDGKLHLDGKPAVLKFGDKQQISAIRQYERETQFVNSEDGLEIEPEFKITAEASHRCVCGLRVCYEEEAANDFDVPCLDNSQTKCRCGRSYILKYCGDSLRAFQEHLENDIN